MNPLMVHLLIVLMYGTGQWQEENFVRFYDKIEIAMNKEVIDLNDVQLVVDAYHAEIPWVQTEEEA